MNALELLNAIACAYIVGQVICVMLCFIKDLKLIGLVTIALFLTLFGFIFHITNLTHYSSLRKQFGFIQP